MLDFLKKLFSSKNRVLTIAVFDDEEPESSTSYRLKPKTLVAAFYGSLAAMALVVLLIVMFTPLGGLIYNREDAELRSSVIEIQQEVAALKDSLAARDMQFADIQQVLSTGEDTTFVISSSYSDLSLRENSTASLEPDFFSRAYTPDLITQNEIIFSGLLNKAPEFPAFYPVEGTLTRGYNPETGHYGIDIATKEHTPFRAIADGAVINRDWTVNYGYILHVQHSNGFISVYKHASGVSQSIGDIVLEGDILGSVGNTGVSSTGPHLHIEIWKNGVPQNPVSYLIGL